MQRPHPDFFRVMTIDKYAGPLLVTGLLMPVLAFSASSYGMSTKITLPLAFVALAVTVGLAVMRYLYVVKVFTTGDTTEAYINDIGFALPVLRSRRTLFSRPHRETIHYTYLVGEKSYQAENWVYVNAMTRKWQRGDMVKVVYDPEQPKQAFIVDVFV